MRVLLIVPPFYRLQGGRNNWMHLGVGYLAVVLARHGYEAKIHNADYDASGRDLTLQDLYNNYHLYNENLNNLDNAIWSDVRKAIRDFRPDLIGVTVAISATFKCVEQIARIAEESDNKIKIMVGGPHITLEYGEVLKKRYIDYAVHGEGEYTLLELVEGRPLDQIRGLSYRDSQGGIHCNEPREFIKNLDALPFPDPNLHLTGLENFENYGVIAASRGCPFDCVFCSSPRLWERKVRFRSVSNVLEELENKVRKYGIKRFYFSDDNITLNKKYSRELFEAIINRNLGISWICEGKVGAFDDEILELMKKAGCRRIKLGVESGSDKVLKYMKKQITTKDIRDTAGLFKKHEMDFTAYLLLGMPVEDERDLEETYNLLCEIEPSYISLSVAVPHIGTELHDRMLKKGGSFPEEVWTDYYATSEKTILNPRITREVIDHFLELNEHLKGRLI